MKRVFIIYGNHGDSPTHLDDMLSYLSELFMCAGMSPAFEKYPVPGALNVVIEYFDKEFVDRIREASSVRGTQFVCIATEMLTGSTFNDFSDGPPKAADEDNRQDEQIRLKEQIQFVSNNAPAQPTERTIQSLDYIKERLKKKLIPRRFRKKGDSAPISIDRELPKVTEYYGELPYWQDRFNNFIEASHHFRSIWCVDPTQIIGYKEAFSEKAYLLPVCSLTPEIAYPLQGVLNKDIDIYFSGSLTPYRREWIQQIKDAGFSVEIGAISSLGSIRENMVARSKICIHLKISESWRYPSIMRLHHLLRSGSVVMSQKAETTCFQEKMVTSFNGNMQETIQTIQSMMDTTDFVESGDQARIAYYENSAGLRNEAIEIASSLM